MQQSCSQKTRKRCTQQWLSSHQLVHSQARSPRNGCNTASSRQGLQGADTLSLPAGCARRRQPSQPPRPAGAYWHHHARTTAAFTRFHSTAREDSKPPLPCHHCQLTWLLCASVSPLVKIPLAKPPLSCLILGATKTMVRLASLTATPVPGRGGMPLPAPLPRIPHRDGCTEHSHGIGLGTAPNHPLPGQGCHTATSRRSARESSQVSPVRHGGARDGAAGCPSCRHTIAAPVPTE